MGYVNVECCEEIKKRRQRIELEADIETTRLVAIVDTKGLAREKATKE